MNNIETTNSESQFEEEQTLRAKYREKSLKLMLQLCTLNTKIHVEMDDGVVVEGILVACDRLNKYLKINQVVTPSGKYQTCVIRWNDIIIVHIKE